MTEITPFEPDPSMSNPIPKDGPNEGLQVPDRRGGRDVTEKVGVSSPQFEVYFHVHDGGGESRDPSEGAIQRTESLDSKDYLTCGFVTIYV